jgi:hypothetical protein
MAAYLRSFKTVAGGRRVNAAFIDLPRPANYSNTQSLTKLNGAYAVGHVKLAQKVLLRLLSASGTYLYETDESSRFMDYFQAGRLRLVPDIRSVLQQTIGNVRRLIADEDLSSGDPLDEQLQDLRIVNISLSGTTADVSLSAITKAGTSFEFTWPIRVV